jgi:LysM repeat protein
MDRQVPAYLTSRLGTVNAEAVVESEGGTAGDISLGRYSTIIKPVSIPSSAPISHQPFTYTVQSGESLDSIATKFSVTVSQIRWSNSNLFSNDSVSTGDQIVIPPVPGVVVTVKGGDTIDSIATTYGVDVVPNGVGGAFPPPPALWQLLMRTGTHGAYNVKVVNCCLGPYTGPPTNNFPAGWCTYYVATKRPVTWSGDAGYWYYNASAKGYAVGPTPKVGSIMVTWESWAGHVAYVEAVYPDGSWMVSEMNWVSFYVIDQRTIRPGQLGSALVGFIY